MFKCNITLILCLGLLVQTSSIQTFNKLHVDGWIDATLQQSDQFKVVHDNCTQVTTQGTELTIKHLGKCEETNATIYLTGPIQEINAQNFAYVHGTPVEHPDSDFTATFRNVSNGNFDIKARDVTIINKDGGTVNVGGVARNFFAILKKSAEMDIGTLKTSGVRHFIKDSKSTVYGFKPSV